jgi:hypothetical protein
VVISKAKLIPLDCETLARLDTDLYVQETELRPFCSLHTYVNNQNPCPCLVYDNVNEISRLETLGIYTCAYFQCFIILGKRAPLSLLISSVIFHKWKLYNESNIGT